MTEEQEAQLADAREKAAEANKGNTNSSKNNRLMNDTLRRVLVQDDALRARSIAEALVSKAEDGDVSAIKEVFDRMEGKAIAKTELTGSEGEPIVIQVTTGIDRSGK
jgi:hypothetical protein